MQMYRAFPKRSGASRGTARVWVKFTTDVEVLNASGDGNIVLPLIGEVSFAIPEGVTPAQTLELRQTMLALLDRDDLMARLCDVLDI